RAELQEPVGPVGWLAQRHRGERVVQSVGSLRSRRSGVESPAGPERVGHESQRNRDRHRHLSVSSFGVARWVETRLPMLGEPSRVVTLASPMPSVTTWIHGDQPLARLLEFGICRFSAERASTPRAARRRRRVRSRRAETRQMPRAGPSGSTPNSRSFTHLHVALHLPGMEGQTVTQRSEMGVHRMDERSGTGSSTVTWALVTLAVLTLMRWITP